MFKCDACAKEFETYRGLNGHKRVHGQSSGSYSVSRVQTNKVIHTFVCLNCSITKQYHPSKSNGKYCSNLCHKEYTWRQVTVPKIEAGECSINSIDGIKRYLKEKHGDQCAICSLPPVWNGKPLVLQLDHINGDSDNNHPSNLRLLCPNCHTQTATFTSRGFGNKGKKDTKRNAHNRERYHQQNS